VTSLDVPETGLLNHETATTAIVHVHHRQSSLIPVGGRPPWEIETACPDRRLQGETTDQIAIVTVTPTEMVAGATLEEQSCELRPLHHL
jgi:hypothetical protein